MHADLDIIREYSYIFILTIIIYRCILFRL